MLLAEVFSDKGIFFSVGCKLRNYWKYKEKREIVRPEIKLCQVFVVCSLILTFS